MGQNFVNYRKKTRRVSLLVSFFLALGVGAAVLAGIILAFKYYGRPVEVLHYIIAVCAVFISFPLFVLVLTPSDKRLAKRLDDEHHLNEKVRTMVEFKDSADPFAELQREDADEKLGKIKFTPWRKKSLISMILVLVISSASLLTAFIVPGRADYVEPEKPLTEFDKQWILTELSDLIDTVEKSLISDPLKEQTLEELVSLKDFVSGHDYLSEMNLQAIKSVIKINGALKNENTALLIGEKLSECKNTTLKELGSELLKLNGTNVQKKIVQLMNELDGANKEEVSFVADEITAAIESSGADTASPFTALMKNLASALHGYSNDSLSSVEDAFGNVKTEAMNQTMIQNINKMITGTVISRLSSLFGITANDLIEAGADEDIDINPPSVLPPEDDGDEGKDENDQIGSGGIGTGDRIYGSNDMIYNPYTDEYVPYGEVFDEYNNKVLQMVEDGRIPQDFEEFIKEYFRGLSDYTPEE